MYMHSDDSVLDRHLSSLFHLIFVIHLSITDNETALERLCDLLKLTELEHIGRNLLYALHTGFTLESRYLINQA